jgi:hypothetical protein
MLKIIFVIIILYIIIQNLLDDSNTKTNEDIKFLNTKANNIARNFQSPVVAIKQTDIKQIQQNPQSDTLNSKNMIFDKPNPWTRIIYNQNDEYPYSFCIKIKISSLNDYENWKKIIPNLNFSSNTGELIIPSKDEPSALALINLISNNLMGKISLKDILDKNLIQISINKAKNYEVVQNKLRDQINETLYGKINIKPNYENDLDYADRKKSSKIDFINNNSDIDNNNNQLVDNSDNYMLPASQSFSNNNYEKFNNDDKDDIEPFEGSDYSYL